jgi:hypothetical protein
LNTTYTVGVFQDVPSAALGIDALLADGFVAESLSIVSKATAEASELIERVLGGGLTLEVKGLGSAVARGSLVTTLQGADDGLRARGLSGTLTRAGFQAHDGSIFEALVGRGGVLVGLQGQPRAADALAKLHAYGGGNAAIGAWHGRV